MSALLGSLDRRLFPPEPQRVRYLRDWLLPECRRVLDVGCGDDAVLLRLVPDLPFTVGVDAKLPAVTSGPGRHSEYRELDVRTLAEAFEPRSFDAVVALDVIEHLTRDEGLRLLDAMEAIATKRVIVFTPNGFLFQPPDADNPHQEHVSGWDVRDLEERGYRVVGINGWRPLRGAYAEPRWRPHAVWRRVSILSQPLVTSRPSHAFHLLAVKDIG